MQTVAATPQQRLRRATRASHDAIDRDHPIHCVLTGPGDGLGAYARLLARLAGWYQPMEARLQREPSLAGLPLGSSRWVKAGWLSADLAALGWQEAIEPAVDADLPEAGDPAGWLGIVYTLEGATLGGIVLAERIADRLGPAVPRAFYTAYGPDNGRYWRQLVTHLNDHLIDDAAFASAALTAGRCFDALRTWLTGARD